MTTLISVAALMIAVAIVHEPTSSYLLSLYRSIRMKQGHNDKRLGHCQVMSVFLAEDKVGDGMFVEGPFRGAPGSVFGGQIAIADASNPSVIVGDYSFFVKFLKTDPSTSYYPSVGNGAYTFGVNDGQSPRDQITWTSSSSNSPFLTITGGQGKYLGAKGYVKIKVPAPGGFIHEIYLCDE
jgi:hypothetical protein